MSPPVEVEGPAFRPYRYGLLSAVEIVTGPDRWELGGVVYATSGCGDSGGEWDTTCPTDPPPPTPPTKDLPIGLDLVEGKPFILYDSAACYPHSGRTEEEIAGFARENLLSGEQRKLEKRFWEWLRLQATAINPTAAPMPANYGLGELEQRVAAMNGGIGVFHSPRWVITAAARFQFAAIHGRPDRLFTAGENVWAFGAGYDQFGPGPDGTAAPEGQAWIYATGPIVLRRSEIFANSVFDHRTNERRTIAERSYVLTAECPALAVLVTIPEG